MKMGQQPKKKSWYLEKNHILNDPTNLEAYHRYQPQQNLPKSQKKMRERETPPFYTSRFFAPLMRSEPQTQKPSPLQNQTKPTKPTPPPNRVLAGDAHAKNAKTKMLGAKLERGEKSNQAQEPQRDPTNQQPFPHRPPTPTNAACMQPHTRKSVQPCPCQYPSPSPLKRGQPRERKRQATREKPDDKRRTKQNEQDGR